MYIDAELINDETAVAEAILAGIADRLNAALGLDPDVDGWVPDEGQPETHLAESVGIVLATATSLVQDTERVNYQGFGSLILGLDPLPAEPAIGYTTWTFNAPGNYKIPDGSEVVLDTLDGTPVGFATVGDVYVEGAAQAVDVQVVALEPGADANTLVGPAREWEPLPFVTGVEMTTAAAGGANEQTTDEYLDAITRRARRMKIVPVVTDDYAEQALDNPAVERAVAVRLLDLDAQTNPPAAEGHVSVFVVDAAGDPVPAAVKDELVADMQGVDRPLGVTVHIGDPTYTDLTVDVSVRLALDADVAATTQAVADALSARYDPTSYGLDDNAPGRWRVPTTAAQRTITAFDVADVASDVDGVVGVTDATVNGGDSVALAGWAPLPRLIAAPVVTVVA